MIKIKVMNLKLFNPELDEDGDYNTPYEITAIINDLEIKVARAIWSTSNGNYNDELFSLANSFEYLSRKGKDKFMDRLLSAFSGPLIYKIKHENAVRKKITKKELSDLKKISEIMRDNKSDYYLENEKYYSKIL